MNVTIKGVEEVAPGRWVAFVERHEPCLDPYGKHEGCTVQQRETGAIRNDIDLAIKDMEGVIVELGESGAIEDWETAGS